MVCARDDAGKAPEDGLDCFLRLLTSVQVGWALTMHSDGLVSREFLRSDAVGAMAGALVGAYCGGWLESWLVKGVVDEGVGSVDIRWLKVVISESAIFKTKMRRLSHHCCAQNSAVNSTQTQYQSCGKW